jgi:hypothetical protein
MPPALQRLECVVRDIVRPMCDVLDINVPYTTDTIAVPLL